MQNPVEFSYVKKSTCLDFNPGVFKYLQHDLDVQEVHPGE